jgi:sulfotransferase family protein
MITTANLPGAMIAGAQKCGTTTLHYSLINHSGINPPIDPVNGTLIKEINFFSSRKRWEMGLEWYGSHFSGEGLSLDSSPNYLSTPSCYQCIHSILPEVKIIICIRDPVWRAYSQYNHYRQDLPQSSSWDWIANKDFLTNLRLEVYGRTNWELDFSGFLSKGIYVNQIIQLLRYFKREQLYITVMEKWRFEYEDELDNILAFLGLERESLPEAVAHKRKYDVEALEPATIELLTDFYRPFNERLFELLGFKIPEWE